MKLSANQENLSAALPIALKAISSRTNMPVLGNVLLNANNEQLRIAATNREISINVWIGATVDEPGATTVPAKLLSEFVNSLPHERIDMELVQRTETLHLACVRYTANMKGVSAGEFPPIPTVDSMQFANVAPVSITPSDLVAMIDRTAFAASVDENRPTLTGVEMKINGNGLNLAATDGFRLSVSKHTADMINAEYSAIVPAKSLAVVASVAKDADTIEIYVAERNVLFAIVGGDKALWQRCEITSELIGARFPDYAPLIPTNATTTATVSTTQLQQAINVAMLYAKDEANIVRFSVGDDAIVVTGQNAETGDSESRIDCKVAGDGLGIALSGRYMTQALKQLPDLVELEFVSPARPLKMHGGTPDEFVHIIMPMQPPRS